MFQRLLAATLAPLLLAACATGSVAATPDSARGVVSAADPRAAEAGAEMLRQGGSATDAAIATMLVLSVVEPQSSGIGGGGFYVRSGPDGTVETLDGREAAPVAAGPDWFLDENGKPRPFFDAVLSGLSVGVPGNIALAAEAHDRHGKLPWKALFQPAIGLARDGFVVTERFREFLERAKNRAAATPEGLALFYDAAGNPLPVGATVRNPALAQTLEAIAAGGRKAFYSGANAQAITDAARKKTPSAKTMVLDDVEAYRAKERTPLCGAYRDYRICGMGPPSSGATTVYAILKQLEGFDLAAMGPDSPTFWHVFAESQRLAYADRELYLADADYVSVPVAQLMDGDMLRTRGAQISESSTIETVTPSVRSLAYAPGFSPPEQGTSHFVAVDRWGEAVTYTSTVEGSFGSGIMVGGYYLNNELTDFSFVPEQNGVPVANRVEPGKRPRSSMAPTLVFGPDGKLVIALGAAGGATIPAQVAKTLIAMLDFGLPADKAIALPLLYAPGNAITVEQGTSLEAMIPALQALGHPVTARGLPLKTNVIERTAAGWRGAADPRSEGAAIGE